MLKGFPRGCYLERWRLWLEFRPFFAQVKTSVMAEIRAAFWNLQNLFDTTVSPIAADLDYTPVHGWDMRAFDKKVGNLAAVIQKMFDGAGPDLLGICEIENANVARKLIEATGRTDYRLAHVDSPDIRGIDTSLIYSTDVFEPLGSPIEHLVHLRFPTRDIFEVPLCVLENGAELHVIVNHWPSRSQGVHESEAFRLTVASHCGTIIDNILKVDRERYLRMPSRADTLKRLNNRWNRNILLMGDFNDEPFSRSILEVLRASNGVDHLEELVKGSKGVPPSYKLYSNRRAYMFNCMWPMLAKPDSGTHFYSQATNTMSVLDQFLISRGLYFGENGLALKRTETGQFDVEIFTPEEMTTPKGRPRPFDRDRCDGYSDHFPILTTLTTDVGMEGKAAA